MTISPAMILHSRLAPLMALTVCFLGIPPCPAWAGQITPETGNTAWVLVSTTLVLMMIIPGLALFYGGLVRSKNMLSVLMHVFYAVCVTTLIWVIYGYSLAFTGGNTPIVGGLSKLFLAGVTPSSTVPTFSNGVMIPELAYIAFQMTFAAISVALIVGAFAERMKFAAVVIFVPLWTTLVYLPIAHMVWYWAGPDALAQAARALAESSPDMRETAQTALDAVFQDSGLIWQWGALDFAGGTVVHINAGMAGLMAALMVGRRIGFGREPMSPHNLTLTMVGASLLWVGWFGFNAGSNLEANGVAALAMLNTFIASAAAALAWMLTEWAVKGKPSLLGIVSGAVAGLVAVTPASGFSGVAGAMLLGAIASPVCFIFCDSIKRHLKYDDALDVFGIHCIGGIIGALATGILVSESFGGTGIADYLSNPGQITIAPYDLSTAMMAQIKAVTLTLIWSAAGTMLCLKTLDRLIGLRVTPDEEREGLDLVDHGERAYNL